MAAAIVPAFVEESEVVTVNPRTVSHLMHIPWCGLLVGSLCGFPQVIYLGLEACSQTVWAEACVR